MRITSRFNFAGLPRTARVLAVSAFLVAVGFGVVIPVLSPFIRTFGVSNLQVGLVVSSFAAVRLVTSPFAAQIGRKLGERNTIAIGMFIVAASSVATALASSYVMLLISRASGGVGSAMFTVSAMNLLLATTPEDLRGRASGLYQGGFLLGNMAGPAVGGLLAAISLQAPFYFYAISLAGAALVTFFMLPRFTPALPTRSGKQSRSFATVARDIRYQAACVAALGQGWQSFGVRNAVIPLIVTEALLLETTWSGIAFAVAAVAQTIAIGPAGSATDRIGRKPVMIGAGLVCGIATLAMPLSANIWVLIAVLCVYGVGAAMQGTAPTAAVGDATGGRGGTPVAIFQMVSDFGAIIGPLAAGALIDAWSFTAAFAVSAAILFAGAAYAAFIPKSLDQEFRSGRSSEA